MKKKYGLERENTRAPFDMAANIICSTIRSTLALGLVRDHHFTQERVAEAFGIKQQAVSNYILGIRGGNRALVDMPEFSNNIKLIAERIRNGATGNDLTLMINKVCMKLLANENIYLAISESRNRNKLNDMTV
jgi:predicted transcriptional regulator